MQERCRIWSEPHLSKLRRTRYTGIEASRFFERLFEVPVVLFQKRTCLLWRDPGLFRKLNNNRFFDVLHGIIRPKANRHSDFLIQHGNDSISAQIRWPHVLIFTQRLTDRIGGWVFTCVAGMLVGRRSDWCWLSSTSMAPASRRLFVNDANAASRAFVAASARSLSRLRCRPGRNA